MSHASERVLLLVGSPKGLDKSNSGRLGRLVLDGLEERGWTSESIHLHAVVDTAEGRGKLLDAVDRADVVLFVSPLYVDSLPAPAIRSLEILAASRRRGGVERIARFASILNCGFVEPSQNDTCQRILQRFADRAGFEWVAGISLGAGGETPKRVRVALDILVEALDLEILVSDEVDRLTRKPRMPGWLYVIGGNLMWRRLADGHGVRNQLRAQPDKRPGR
jgi:hypothetical protein